MKKTFLFMTVLLCLSSSLFAYAPGNKLLYGGFGFGLSSADSDALSGRDFGLFKDSDPELYKNSECDPAFAYSAGAAFDYFFMKNLAVTTGLSYDSTPVRISYDKNTAPDNVEYTYNLAFLTVPVGVHYFIEDMLIVGGGFYFAKDVSNDAKIEEGYERDSMHLRINNDFGLFLDLGGNFKVTEEGSIIAFIRYKHGLSEVYDDTDIISDIKVRTITLNLAYGIRL